MIEKRFRLLSHAAAACVCVLLVVAAPASELSAQSAHAPETQDALRVCADPNNMPFSNSRGEGFENRLAELVARDLGKKRVAYKFFPQRRGFMRNTLTAGLCDVVMGVPSALEMVRTTSPYYRSTYVFVTRHETGTVRSFDDPRLRTLRIGIHVIGDDYSNVPPAEALATRGIVDNVHGFPVYGPYSEPDPPRALLDAVSRGDIDVAIAWGPLAGYFARRESIPLELSPVSPASMEGPMAMTFDISMGVRRGDEALRASLERFLSRRHTEVRRLLESYGVPLLPVPAR